MTFKLHPCLQQDTINLGHFELCRLLLMNDSQYPWFILVPEINNLTEIYQLSKANRVLLMEESCYLAEQLTAIFNADKLNIATIGNKVSQLHIHHLVRYKTDISWPQPVWGKFAAVAYNDDELQTLIARLESSLVPKLQLPVQFQEDGTFESA